MHYPISILIMLFRNYTQDAYSYLLMRSYAYQALANPEKWSELTPDLFNIQIADTKLSGDRIVIV